MVEFNNLQCEQTTGGKEAEQRYDTTEGESRTKSPLMSRRAALADRDLIQSLHAAASRCFVISKTCKPAHSCSEKCQRADPAERVKHDKRITDAFSGRGSKNTQTDALSFISRRPGTYVGQLWTLIGALRVCLLSSSSGSLRRA